MTDSRRVNCELKCWRSRGIRIHKSSGAFYVEISNLCFGELMFWLKQELVKYDKQGSIYV